MPYKCQQLYLYNIIIYKKISQELQKAVSTSWFFIHIINFAFFHNCNTKIWYIIQYQCYHNVISVLNNPHSRHFIYEIHPWEWKIGLFVSTICYLYLMAWHWTGDKTFSHHLNQWLLSLLMNICITVPRWVYTELVARHLLIIWTNDCLVYWCIYASLGLDEFVQQFVCKFNIGKNIS